MTSRLHAAARAYADHGWHVFPCRPGEKVPATAHGVHEATTDLAQIDAWWTADPDRNVGIATGATSGIYVLDIDGMDGYEAFAELAADHSAPLPSALWQATPSGGMHGMFRHPGGHLPNTAGRLAPNVDTRGDGGYILAAPSVHPNGGRYRWLAKTRPPMVPGWLLRLLRKMPRERTHTPVDTSEVSGERYIRAAVTGELEAVRAALEGNRNHRLNEAAWRLGRFVGADQVNERWVSEQLYRAGVDAGLREREVELTVESGLGAGKQHPWEGAA